jgi:hypothetical protein
VIRFFSTVISSNALLSGLILANALGILALAFLHQFVAARWGVLTADRTVILLLAFPGALFLAFPYTEPLFLLLTVLSVLALSRNNYAGAGIAAFLATLTRPTGVLCTLPMLADVLRKRNFRALTFCFLPVLGFACYFGVIKLLTGSATAGFAAQAEFITGHSMSRLLDPLSFLQDFFDPPRGLKLHGPLNSIIDRIWLFWFVAGLAPIYKQDRTLFVYTLSMGLVPALTGHMMSYTRFVMMAFPMFLVPAQWSRSGGRNLGFILLAAALFALQMYLLVRHMNFYWAG